MLRVHIYRAGYKSLEANIYLSGIHQNSASVTVFALLLNECLDLWKDEQWNTDFRIVSGIPELVGHQWPYNHMGRYRYLHL